MLTTFRRWQTKRWFQVVACGGCLLVIASCAIRMWMIVASMSQIAQADGVAPAPMALVLDHGADGCAG
jgi:hypothetical protein